MGMTRVTLIIKNPSNPQKKAEAKFLVDSGAHYTVIPFSIVKELNLKPVFEQEFSLADGRIVKRKIGAAIIGFEGKELPMPVVLGEKGDEGLLGVLTLENFGLMLDPFNRRLYKVKLMLANIKNFND